MMAQTADFYAGLTEIFQDVFQRDDITLSEGLTAQDVEQIEIVMATEEKWGIKFNTRDLDSLHCVGDLVNLIAAKTRRS